MIGKDRREVALCPLAARPLPHCTTMRVLEQRDGGAEHDVGILLQELDLPRELARQPAIVGIQERDITGTRLANPRVAGAAHSAVALAYYAHRRTVRACGVRGIVRAP